MAKTIVIDESRCNGCGLCVKACHEGALSIVDGKARMTDAMLCDGIGDCLPACPQDAISFKDTAPQKLGPMVAMDFQWPIKLELVSERNPMFDGKHLLIAADCSAFARASVMNEFGRDGIRIIGCPKLGEVDLEKLKAIVSCNDIRSIDVVRMEVPCCGPLALKVAEAVSSSGKDIPLRTVVLSRDGSVRA
ncbi:MAG: 4Fe-4S binding protein [Candidatus Methanomethylophilaceae archaeon]|nr:4Fe-4S binding protein [Candidatus Methanomethylophilaceae archaeon]